MIYLAVLVAFWAGYLIHILQQTLKNQLDHRQECLTELVYAQHLCQLTEQMNHSLQLNMELLDEKRRLQRCLYELQDQHERTLAVLN